MDRIDDTRLIKFNVNQLEDVRKEFGYNVDRLNQEIDLLQEWMRKQNHFVVREFDRKFLERHLIANKGFIERSKKRFDRLFTLRNLMPDLLRNFDFDSEFIPLFKFSYQVILPKPTHDNYRILLSYPINVEDIEKLDLIQYYRFVVVALEYLMVHDYSAGYICVYDTRIFNMSIVAKINPMLIHRALTMVVEGYGLRVKSMHIISDSKLLDRIIILIKQGLSEKLGKRLQVHRDNESLHKFIPKELLPKELGGDVGPVKELFDVTCKELFSEEHKKRMDFLETAVTDETKRLSTTFNEEYSGMPGSFKTLSVD